MRFRCLHSYSYAGLSGLPNYDCTRVPLLVALWYSIASSKLKIPPGNDPARLHIFYSTLII